MEQRYLDAIRAKSDFSDPPTVQEVQDLIDSVSQDLGELFEDQESFNSSYVVNWDVSAVADMGEMFRDATSFNQDIGDWNVGSVSDMNSMFRNADAFDQDIGDWDISSLTDASYMLDDSGMSEVNFDKLLAGCWTTLDTAAGETAIYYSVILGADGLTYTDATSYNHLTRALLDLGYGWSITGARLAAGIEVGSNTEETLYFGGRTDGVTVHALDGDDNVYGGSGDDYIVGGAGDDKLSGDGGADTFVYKFINAGNDRIFDFTLGEDKIDVGQLIIGYEPGVSDIADWVAVSESGGGTVVLTIDRDGTGSETGTVTITLDSISYSDIDPDTFVLGLENGILVLSDGPQITGATTGSIDEDASPDTVSGNLDHTDVGGDDANAWTAATASDNGYGQRQRLRPATTATASDNGYGTYTMTADGVWTYTLDNTHAAIDALDESDEVTDTFKVTTGDGTAQQVTVTITRADEPKAEQIAAMTEIYEDSSSDGVEDSNNGVLVTDDQLALVAARVLQGSDTAASSMEARYQAAIPGRDRLLEPAQRGGGEGDHRQRERGPERAVRGGPAGSLRLQRELCDRLGCQPRQGHEQHVR